MTCKECIHYEVCTQLCTGIDMSLLMRDEYADRLCSDFMDKSKYIELPCKVGDTVYIISDGDALEQEVIVIEYDGEFSVVTMCPCYSDCHTGDPCITLSNVCQSHYTQFDFGRDVFFTREEAEKALLMQ